MTHLLILSGIECTAGPGVQGIRLTCDTDVVCRGPPHTRTANTGSVLCSPSPQAVSQSLSPPQRHSSLCGASPEAAFFPISPCMRQSFSLALALFRSPALFATHCSYRFFVFVSAHWPTFMLAYKMGEKEEASSCGAGLSLPGNILPINIPKNVHGFLHARLQKRKRSGTQLPRTPTAVVSSFPSLKSRASYDGSLCVHVS